jgi:hypothetical protein
MHSHVVQKVDLTMLKSMFFSSQFPVCSGLNCYEAIDKFVQNEQFVTKVDKGIYDVGFGKQQLSFIHSLMMGFDMGEFHKMVPYQITIQRTGLSSGGSRTYENPPDNHLRFILNYREQEGKFQVAIKSRIGPGGIIYTSQSYATVLQRNLSTVEISSSKELMETRRETCNSYFIIADMRCPTSVIMQVVNKTAGARPIDFDKVMNKPGVKKVIDGIMETVDKGGLDMETGMEMVKKIISQQQAVPTAPVAQAASTTQADVEGI